MYGIVREYSMEMMYIHDSKNFFIAIVIVMVSVLHMKWR